MSKFITIEVSSADKLIIDELKSKGINSKKLVTSSFDGDVDVISILVELAKYSIPLLMDIIRARVDLGYKVRIIYKGAALKEIDEERLNKLIEKD